MRIAEVAPVWLPVPPTGYGGTERVVSLLADGLTERGHDVTLFASGGSRSRAALVSPLSAPPHPDDPESTADDIFHTLSAFLHAGDFDVIHDHTGLGPALGSMLGDTTPVVHTLHGPWTPLGRRYFSLVHRFVHLVAISGSQQALNADLRYAGVVHNGVDTDGYPFRDAKDDFLLFVGRCSPEKGPEVAVDVAKRAGRPLTMVIKRSERAEHAYWDEVVRPRLGGDEEVLEQPPEALKIALYQRAHATLFPIQWPEPFGLVMAESMACGTPVIAFARGAAPEVIDHGVTGFLCEGPEEMADAVASTSVLSPAACRERVARYFSVDAMVSGYEAVFRRLVHGGAPVDLRPPHWRPRDVRPPLPAGALRGPSPLGGGGANGVH